MSYVRIGVVITTALYFALASGEIAEYMISNSETGEVKYWKSEESHVGPSREKRAVLSPNAAYFTNEEIKIIVDTHNNGRKVVNPTASNMKRIVSIDICRIYRGYPAKRALSAMRKHGG